MAEPEHSPATEHDHPIFAPTLHQSRCDPTPEGDDTFVDALQSPSTTEAESLQCSFSGALRRRRSSPGTDSHDSSPPKDRLFVDVPRPTLESRESDDDEAFVPAPLLASPYPLNLHHRRLFSGRRRSSAVSGGGSEFNSDISGTSTGEGRFAVKPESAVHEIACESAANKDGDDGFVCIDSSAQLGRPWWSFLICMAKLVIKAIGFVLKLAFRLLSFPALFLWYYYAFTTSPFQTTRIVTKYLMGKFVGVAGFGLRSCSPFKSKWSKLTMRVSWGLLCSALVCIILVGLLIFSFVMSGLAMRYLAGEQLHMKETLYFDYTKNIPEANFPITSCVGASCGMDCGDKFGVKKGLRVIPHNHKFQVTVSLTLPESDYNRNLGIFQVRVDCISANGLVLATSRHPCMLPFKSRPVRHLLTWLKIAPLLAGYASESQTMSLQLRGFTEMDIPTACLRVMIEPRAKWHQVAGGVPEIYDASLLLESDLTFLQRIQYHWKKTAFVWISMAFFLMGLLLVLICFMPILLRQIPREDSAKHTFL